MDLPGNVREQVRLGLELMEERHAIEEMRVLKPLNELVRVRGMDVGDHSDRQREVRTVDDTLLSARQRWR